MSDALRFRLRSETRAAHARLDATILGLFESDRGYGLYLQGAFVARRTIEALLHAPVAATEPALARFEPSLVTAIAGDLDRDLADLGLTPEHKRDLQNLPMPLDAAGRWGMAYVLAGSALGAGRLQQWAARLGFSAMHGARHLASQTADARQWPRFVAALNRLELTERAANRCIEGAQRAFLAFERALEPMVDA